LSSGTRPRKADEADHSSNNDGPHPVLVVFWWSWDDGRNCGGDRIIYGLSNKSGVQPLNPALGIVFFFILFFGMIITSIGGSGDPMEWWSEDERSCQAV
jgi:hypothetical protein